jgi:hypothetical protein
MRYLTVYKDRQKFKAYRKFYLRDNKKDTKNANYFMMLSGVNVSGDVVEPVYTPWFTILRRPGLVGIMFPKTIILFMGRFPWVVVETTGETYMEWE